MNFMQIETYHGHFQRINNTSEGDILTPEECAEYPGNEEAAAAYNVSLKMLKPFSDGSAACQLQGILIASNGAAHMIAKPKHVRNAAPFMTSTQAPRTTTPKRMKQ